MIAYLDASVVLRLVLGRDRYRPLVLATHDKVLRTAAVSVGLAVIGG